MWCPPGRDARGGRPGRPPPLHATVAVPTKAGNTTNLIMHLKNKHPTEHSEFMKEKTSAIPPTTSSKSGPSQPKIASAFAGSTPYEKTSRRHIQITNAVTDFICNKMLPIRTVDDRSFKSLLQTLDPRYALPGRNFFSKTEIPRLYEEKRSLILAELKSVHYYATTSDLWSSQNSIPYISLTIHFINDSWHLKSYCLGTQFIPEDHTGENIAEDIEDILDNWSLKVKNQVCITTDSGSNMVKAAEIRNWPRLQCFGHRLHSAIGEYLSWD